MLDKHTNSPQYELFSTCQCVQNTDPASTYLSSNKSSEINANLKWGKIKCARGQYVIIESVSCGIVLVYVCLLRLVKGFSDFGSEL